MTSPLLIRGSSRKWDIQLTVLGGGALLALSYWLNDHQETVWAVVTGVAGVALIAVAIGFALYRALCWQTVEVEPNGFVLRDRSSEQAFGDDQIQTAAIKVKQNYANGTLTSRTRWFYVWVDGDPGPARRIAMRNTIGLSEADPLAEFIDRVCGRLIGQARGMLDRGREVTGDGLALSRDMLEIAARPEPLRTRLQEIEAAEIVENKLDIWRRGDESAWAKIPSDSSNAFVLTALLNEDLAKRGERGSPTDGDTLGRLLFERRPTRGHVGILIALTLGPLLAAAATLFLVLRPPQNANDGVHWIVPLLLAIVALGLSLLVLHAMLRAFRVHERGVVLSGLRGRRSLMYRDVEAFTFTATRMYHNGAYAGTAVSFNLESAPGGPPRLKYSTTIHNNDEMVEMLREHISGMVGRRMFERAQAGEPVEWTPNLRFENGQVIYRPSGLMGRKEPVAYPLSSITTFEFRDGTCLINVEGQPKPLIKEPSKSRNFFPGFVCLSLLVTHARDKTDATSD